MSNENSERDTHFLQAATILLRAQAHLKLDPEGHVLVSDAQKLYANFLYDFEQHSLDHIASTDYCSEGTPINVVFKPEDIPDLKEWPDTSPPKSF